MTRARGKRIDRRKFLEVTGAGVAGATLMSQLSNVTLAAPAVNSSQRRVFPLNHKWLYSEKNVAGGTSPRFNDTGFARVTIPHTNKLLPWHGFDDKDYQFVSLYRRHFRMPAGLSGRRVFVDFGGVMTAATVTFNGQKLGEYRGGYTPFSFELTSNINWRGDNVLAVEVDSTERNDIPPFGGDIDYLTFGGIYRDVGLRVVPAAFIENVFAKPVDVLSNNRSVNVRCYLDTTGTGGGPRKLTAELRDGNRVISTQSVNVSSGASHHDITLTNLGAIELWESGPSEALSSACLFV